MDRSSAHVWQDLEFPPIRLNCTTLASAGWMLIEHSRHLQRISKCVDYHFQDLWDWIIGLWICELHHITFQTFSKYGVVIKMTAHIKTIKALYKMYVHTKLVNTGWRCTFRERITVRSNAERDRRPKIRIANKAIPTPCSIVVEEEVVRR